MTVLNIYLGPEKNENFYKRVFDTSYFSFSGHKLLGATMSVG